MHPFRTVGTREPDPGFAIQVIGHRMPFPQAVDVASMPSWFAFLFHHPVIIRSAGADRTLPAGSVVVLGPGDAMQHRPRGQRLDRSWIRCTGSQVAAAVAASGIARGEPHALARTDGVLDTLLALYRAMVHPRGSSAAHLHALFQAWLACARRDAGPARPEEGGIAAVRERLESSWRRPPPLDELARTAGCSRAQFSRRFRRAVGCSPGEYAMRLRLEAAQERLIATDDPIAAIAEDGGFTDRFHFSRAFAARHGMGPAAYRAAGRPSDA